MDAADITSQHDFTEEALKRHLTTQKKEVTRGFCLNCNAQLPDKLIYCDEDCREDHETQLRINKRTRR